MKKLLCALVASSFLCGSIYAGPRKLPTPEIETLPNGLTLVWFLNKTLPLVDIVTLVRSGYRDDPAGRSGTAELVSAALDRGSAGMTPEQIARAVERLGASRYSSADDDTFSVGIHGLASDGPVLLDLLSKIVLRPDFKDEEIRREHARIVERWQHIGDYPESLASLAFQRVISAGTVYGRGSFVSMKEFKKVGPSDVRNYYKRNFTPKNTILMIVGRADQAAFRKSILATFGSWKGEAPARSDHKWSDQRLARAPGELILVDRPGVTQAQVRIGFPAPSIHSPDHFPLTVANALLGEYFNSRLMSIIRDKLGLTYSIGSSFSYSEDFAHFGIGSATRTEMTSKLITKTLEILKNLKTTPVPATEVKMAKDYLVGGFPLRVATLPSVASRWLGSYVMDLGKDYLNRFVPSIEQVDAQAVSGAVGKDFRIKDPVIVVAGDASKLAPQLKAAGFKIKRVTARDLM
jgi:zinc protease